MLIVKNFRKNNHLENNILITVFICSVLEYYDYALYVQFLFVIENEFFPANPVLRNFLSTLSFIITLLIRPAGSIFLGYIGDKKTKTKVIGIIILVISISTACIALIPSYSKIGYASTILIFIIRIIQGFAVGGIIAPTLALILEKAPLNKKLLYSSFANVSLCLGSLLAMFIGIFFMYYYSHLWKLLFVFSACCTFFIYFINKTLKANNNPQTLPQGIPEDSTNRNEAGFRKLNHLEIKNVLTSNKKNGTICILLGAAVIPYHTVFILMSRYLKDLYLFSNINILYHNASLLFISILLIPIWGYFADKVSSYKVINISSILLIKCIILISILGYYIDTSYKFLLFIEILIIIGWTGYCSVINYITFYLFPKDIRCIVFGFYWSVGVCMFSILQFLYSYITFLGINFILLLLLITCVLAVSYGISLLKTNSAKHTKYI